MKITYEAQQPFLLSSDEWITAVRLTVNGVTYRISETSFEGEIRLETEERIGIMPESPTSMTISTDVRVME